MFSKIWTKTSTKNYSEQIKRLQAALQECEAVVIGAGSGLSTAAGYTYTGERFQKYFADFANKYGIRDMYSGGFYPFPTQEEFWGYWSRYIFINRYMDAPKPVYEKLLRLVADKDYFVITTNVDHCFQKAGFAKKRLFYMQGDYGLFQCSEPCCRKTYDNEISIRKMLEEQKDMQVSAELIPYCPICGKPMTMNLHCDATFVQDDGWYRASQRYKEFLELRVLFLELGVGMNTPAIIKFPFWHLANEWENGAYACINLGEAYAPEEIEAKSICINENIGIALQKLIDRGSVQDIS